MTNTGGVDLVAADVSIQDDLTEVLDDAIYNGDADQGAVYADPVLSWTGDLAMDQVVVIAYTLTINDADALGDGQLLNAVTGAPNCPDPAITDPADSAFNPDCVVAGDIAGWTALKTSDAADPVLPGDTVNYTITVENTGAVDLDDPSQLPSFEDDLADVLDDAVYNNDADSAGAGTLNYAEPTLSWDGPLVIGQVVTIRYSVTVADADQLGDGRLLNVLTGPPNCTVPTTTGLGAPAMPPGCGTVDDVSAWVAVKTSDAVDPLAPGDDVTYAITVTNTGHANLAAADVVVTDDMNDVLDDAAYNGDGDDGGQGTLMYAEPVLTWSGELAVDEVVTITYSVTVNDAADFGDRLLLNAVTGSPNCPDPAVTDPAAAGFDANCTVRGSVASTGLPDTAIAWVSSFAGSIPIGLMVLGTAAIGAVSGFTRRRRRSTRSHAS